MHGFLFFQSENEMKRGKNGMKRKHHSAREKKKESNKEKGIEETEENKDRVKRKNEPKITLSGTKSDRQGFVW